MALADTQAMHSVCGPHTITPRFPHKENSLAKSCQGCLLVSPGASMTSYHDVNKAQGWECLGAGAVATKPFVLHWARGNGEGQVLFMVLRGELELGGVPFVTSRGHWCFSSS